MDTPPSRRHFLRLGLGGLVGLACAPSLFETSFASASSPHFLLQIIFTGGLDAANFLDARPLAFKAAGLWQNPFNEDPRIWRGLDGNETFVTRAAAPLQRVKDSISVVNGVVMSTSFDGHEQNEHIWHTCDAFGGPAIAPQIGVGRGALDWVQSGSFLGKSFTNTTNSTLLDLATLRDLRAAFSTPPLVGAGRLTRVEGPGQLLARERMRALAAGQGVFSQAAGSMERGLVASKVLGAALARVKGLPGDDGGGGAGTDDPADPYEDLKRQCAEGVAMALALFRAGVTSTVTLSLYPSLDAHDAKTAQEQPKTVEAVAEAIARAVETLKETSWDERTSFLDRTTLVVGSEFSRTMRQTGTRMEDTGTDHNALTNTVLLAGKGLLGGRVVGASDAATLGDGVFSDLSGSHGILDPSGLKAMGRPFDFSTGRVRADRPDTFNVRDHIMWPSVVNTLLDAFGLSASAHRAADRFGTPAPVLKSLLA